MTYSARIHALHPARLSMGGRGPINRPLTKRADGEGHMEAGRSSWGPAKNQGAPAASGFSVVSSSCRPMVIGERLLFQKSNGGDDANF